MNTKVSVALAATVWALTPMVSAQEVKPIGTSELKVKATMPIAQWDFALVDSRSETEFDEGHIPGAVLIPAKKTGEKLPSFAKDKARLVVFYCNGPGCTKSLKGAKLAIAAGYTNVREYNEGLPAWQAAGLKVLGTPLAPVTISLVASSALKEQLAGPSKPVLLDIRDADEFETFHLDGSVNIPLDLLTKRVTEIPPGKICIVDHIAHQGPVAARLLSKLGRKDLTVLDGGIMAWSDAGFPVIAKK
jgi:rhodanese-related sulfurtransferase